MPSLAQRLHHLLADRDASDIANITRGLEKESLRVTQTGDIAQTPHPKALGSALSHPDITTDYSEALLEFITEPGQDIPKLIETLHLLHRFTYRNIDDEVLWTSSMPCMLSNDDDIPVAQYGSSNSAKMKTIYRLGLGHRYGRGMQTIAGIHYNFSVSDQLWQSLRFQDRSDLALSEYKTQGYFHLIRNFKRYFWLLLYLYGAAPAVCKTFIKHDNHPLVPTDDESHTLHAPYATSLRMGNLGYQSDAQNSLHVTYNCLESYTQTLCAAITQTHSAYADIGIKDKAGKYQQLNAGLLQIENEFYSVIRPKRTAKSGQTALNALSEGGVEYIEVRCLDLNPFEPVGISEEQIRFLDCFLLYCLLEESPLSNDEEYEQLQTNQKRMVYEGREPELMLYYFGKERRARAWGEEIMDALVPIASLLDQQQGDTLYQQSLDNERAKLRDDQLTPAAKVLASMKEDNTSFYRFAMNQSIANKAQLMAQGLPEDIEQAFKKSALDSIAKQISIEKSDSIDFETFLANYYEQYQCCSETEA